MAAIASSHSTLGRCCSMAMRSSIELYCQSTLLHLALGALPLHPVATGCMGAGGVEPPWLQPAAAHHLRGTPKDNRAARTRTGTRP